MADEGLLNTMEVCARAYVRHCVCVCVCVCVCACGIPLVDDFYRVKQKGILIPVSSFA